MTAYDTRAAAGPSAGPFTPDRRDWLRLLGGLAFAAGALVLGIRKETDWSDWVLLLVYAAPCALLYATAFAARRRLASLQGWETAYLAFAVVLLPVVLLQFVAAVDGNTSAELNIAWTLGLSAAVSAVTAVLTGARWQMLIAGLYAFVAWLALWSKILDDLSEDRLRGILASFALILLLAAFLSARGRRPFTSDLVTVAGIAGLLMALVGLAGLAGQAVDLQGVLPDDARPEQGWNIVLLAVSLLLLAYGSRAVTRGPSYVGGIGLFVFVFVVGQDVVAAFNADEGQGVVGWPLILLLGGAALAAASFAVPPSGGGRTTEPPNWFGGGGDGVAGAPGGAPAAQPQAPSQQAAPPPPGGGGGLLDSWRHQPPPGGGQPPQ